MILLLSGFLLLLFFFILFIPSGKECPKCKSHYTASTKVQALRADTQKLVSFEFNRCFKCEEFFNMREDGRLVDKDGNYLPEPIENKHD